MNRTRRPRGAHGQLVICDVCRMQDPSGIPGTVHRRCGGKVDAPRRAKHNMQIHRGRWASPGGK